MQGVTSKLDWSRMLGFEQIADDRAAGKLDPRNAAKVGGKPGIKSGIKVGIKLGIKAGIKV